MLTFFPKQNAPNSFESGGLLDSPPPESAHKHHADTGNRACVQNCTGSKYFRPRRTRFLSQNPDTLIMALRGHLSAMAHNLRGLPTLGISPVVQLLGTIVACFTCPTTEVSSWQIRYSARKSVVKAFTSATATSGRRSITWIHRRTIASIYRKIGTGVPTVTVWNFWTLLDNH